MGQGSLVVEHVVGVQRLQQLRLLAWRPTAAPLRCWLSVTLLRCTQRDALARARSGFLVARGTTFPSIRAPFVEVQAITVGGEGCGKARSRAGQKPAL